MAKYTGADCRLCRREGEKLGLKGDKCTSDKCPFLKRSYVPGQHGQGRKKVSEYGQQLREKQKCKRIYGLQEKQFKKYYEKAEKMRGITGENMLCLLERRLDNVVYRLGLGLSRAHARQLVNHGLITVDGNVVSIPSFLIKKDQVISIKARERSKAKNSENKSHFDELKEQKVSLAPEWLVMDNATLTGKVDRLPVRSDIRENISEHMIVELYSK